ncbi:hypothetical protein CROQUDRAFT_720147 [Cronartium quercuum f. sp. fusiforme G11]|uniref:glutathione-specific gamma-glutamylcyclotransferase n=1 Tax=Cronartium quercuum f. sp. fusiforme G11 TaxID=708437 RepID=A0A9P6NPJ1_9BASI|nr:hypothetical protein CROQUDRAFT_720147 [Cronartium quercuum f. sp. fusiforme G11]
MTEDAKMYCNPYLPDSLIWKPPPYVTEQKAGYIKGFTRRFAQSSHDHRGTPENPGRVVTLVPHDEWMSLPGADDLPSTFVWGVVYTIDPSHVEEVKAYLDERERDGYEMVVVEVFEEGDKLLTKVCLLTRPLEFGADHTQQSHVYVGHTNNPSFAGPMPLEELGAHIFHSVGPSGPNKDYLYNLHREVQKLCPGTPDLYLSRLTEIVIRLDSSAPLS